MGFPTTNDYGSRINEILSLRILESFFDPAAAAAATVVVGPRIEFDLSLSSTHVLNAILQHVWLLTVKQMTITSVLFIGSCILILLKRLLGYSIRTTTWHAWAFKLQSSSFFCSQEYVFATMCTGSGKVSLYTLCFLVFFTKRLKHSFIFSFELVAERCECNGGSNKCSSYHGSKWPCI